MHGQSSSRKIQRRESPGAQSCLIGKEAVRGKAIRPGLTRLPPLLLLACCLGCVRPVVLAERPVPPPPCGAIEKDTPGTPAAAVRWQSPDDLGDRRALAAGCREVGAVSVREAVSAPLRAARVAIVSWNLHVGRGDVRRLVTDLRHGRLGTGAPPDALVLLLQEAWRGDGREPRDIVRVARELGLGLYYVPSVPNARQRTAAPDDRGTAILSSLPLGDLQALELPFERQRRVAVRATLGALGPAGPWTLRVLSVHFENRAGRRRAWLRSRAARVRQAEALAAALPASGATVLGGDLNTWSGRERSVEILASHFDPWRDEDRRPTFGTTRLDYLFKRLPARAQMTYRTLDDRYGSDHAPLVGLLVWDRADWATGHSAPPCCGILRPTAETPRPPPSRGMP
jgi:endonuclease/exonuclease/phosphatase family metal-dependent hydrolase